MTQRNPSRKNAERLAQALRDNLRRRKDQQRLRAAPGESQGRLADCADKSPLPPDTEELQEDKT